MLTLTIQEIITEINIERVKSKDSIKELEQRGRQSLLNYSSQHFETSTKSISPDYQRSCSKPKTIKQGMGSIYPPKIFRKKWTKKEQQLLCILIGRYGSDFTFLQGQFPNKTRKQLKKKYQEIHKNKQYLNKIERIQQSIIRQRRKSLFDEEIMQISSEGINEEIPKVQAQIKNVDYHDIQQESQSY